MSDWGTEVPMTLSIERVGGPPNSLFSQLGGFAIPGIGPLVVGSPLLTALVSLIPPLADPPPILRGAVAAIIMALGIQREATYMAVATTDPATGQPIAPNVLKNPARNAEFLATQLQSAGYFQLADDQALVVTVDPGSAGYFVLPVTNDWTISNDYWNQQTSLNNSQAIANSDGTYTLVIRQDRSRCGELGVDGRSEPGDHLDAVPGPRSQLDGSSHRELAARIDRRPAHCRAARHRVLHRGATRGAAGDA